MSEAAENTDDNSESLLAGADEGNENSQQPISPNAEEQPSKQVVDEQASEKKDEGERPEFLLEKYSSVDDQAKAYVDLQKKFGSFTGAPEKYEFNKDEKYTNIDVEADDPVLLQGMETAKEMGMDQAGFDKFAGLIMDMRQQELSAVETHKDDQMKLLGDNAQQRVSNLNDFMKANMPENVYESAVVAANSADAIVAFEFMMSKASNVQQNVGGDRKVADGVTLEELQKLQFETNENGDRRMSIDPQFRKRVELMADKLYGTEPHRETVG